jgi:hypothetical protein
MKIFRLKQTVAFLITAVGLTGLGAQVKAQVTVGSTVVGTPGDYNYSPSVMQIGNVQYFYWCSAGTNPNDSSQYSDTIKYESINLSTGATVGPEIVLAETPGTWDSEFTCNPKVVTGQFTNPLGNGTNYTEALYYVATNGGANSIGVAFSNDGVTWAKYPNPVIAYNPNDTGYGVGQPAAYNSDGAGGIWLLYEDTYPSEGHWLATSTDGVHFTTQGQITTNGINQVGIESTTSYGSPTWGDAAYDYEQGLWYAVFNTPGRDAATTGGVSERGSIGTIVYSIPASSLLSGSTAWTQVYSVDTNLTGYECNFLPGFLRDSYGNVNIGDYPSIEIYISASVPQPAWNATPGDRGNSCGVPQWLIQWDTWKAGAPLVPFQRYSNGSVHEVTTGWIDPNGGWTLEGTMGYLYSSPQAGATVAVYGCLAGQSDYFASTSSDCENNANTAFSFLGIDGYLFASPGSGLEALYRCYTGADHFVSTSSNCEGQQVDYLMGYAKISQ